DLYAVKIVITKIEAGLFRCLPTVQTRSVTGRPFLLHCPRRRRNSRSQLLRRRLGKPSRQALAPLRLPSLPKRLRARHRQGPLRPHRNRLPDSVQLRLGARPAPGVFQLRRRRALRQAASSLSVRVLHRVARLARLHFPSFRLALAPAVAPRASRWQPISPVLPPPTRWPAPSWRSGPITTTGASGR